jgi:hypothetical protein
MNACLAGKNTNFFLWDFSFSLVIIAVKNIKTTLYHHTTKIGMVNVLKYNSKFNVFCVCWFLHSSEIWELWNFFCYFDRNQVLVMTDVSFGRCQTSVSFCFGFSLFRGFYSSLSGPKTECLFVLFGLLKCRFCNFRGVIICWAKKLF